MLYYIIPPIIIILSLSTLIFFLFRKVSDLPEGVVAVAPRNRIKWNRFGEFFSVLGHFGLKVLERLMQKIKLFSLKFHNISNVWFHSIRKKREEHRLSQEQKRQVILAENKFVEKENELTPKNQVEIAKKVSFASKSEDIVSSLDAENEAPVIERKSRMRMKNFQMVSSRVTKPERKSVVTKVKNKMEDALIKRIAINPRDIEAYERLGDYYIEQDNLQDALECYRQVLRLSPVHHKAKMKINKIERVLAKGF